MKIKFYLLRPDSKTETGLLVSVSYKTERLRLGIDESINPKFWNLKTSRARSTPSFPQAPEFNQRLESIKSGIEKCYYEFLNEDNQPPTKEQLRTLIQKNVLSKQKILSFFDFYNEFIEDTARGARLTKKGKVVAPESSKQYRVAYSTLKEYNPKLNFNDITDKFYSNYLKFLNSKGLAINTIGDQIKKLKTVMAASYKAGYHRNEAFKDFIKLSEPADNIYLSIPELKEIENLNLTSNPSLDRVRDLFLIGAFTGLRQSDFSRLRPQHIKKGFITIDQTKTGEDVVIPVHSIVKKIIAKYNGNLPAAISGQKFNEAIKEVCKQVPCLIGNESKRRTQGGLKIISTLQKWEMISSHTCRRSFCTNQYLAGMPTLTIMAVSGHETETSFLKYIKVSKNEHAERMQEVWEKKENKLMAV
ncbi:MAG TPA: phage integrase SAM-like domain-containing protein [Hanamia sp.]|nr:phage integrase SAM-like domain-containing protein [Hanamia sp.]